VEKVERGERVETVETVETVERVETVEAVETVERMAATIALRRAEETRTVRGTTALAAPSIAAPPMPMAVCTPPAP
jgi:hypothetical protein